MTKTSEATIIKAVEQVLTLRKNGVSLKNARLVVAGEFKTNVHQVTQWMKEHAATTTPITKTNRESTIMIDYTFNDISTDVRGVLKSIINQDGRYTTREAGVIGKLYGAELSRAKLLLEVHKHNTKVSSSTTSNNILNLN